MKHSILIFLFLIGQICSFGQFKGKAKEWKTDTVDVFSKSKDKFYEEDIVFLRDSDKTVLRYTQSYDDPCCIDDESTSNLLITFNNWDGVELDNDYNLADLEASFEVIAFLVGEFDKPSGRVRLIKKTDESLTFAVDVSVQSTDKRVFLMFKGDREFKRTR